MLRLATLRRGLATATARQVEGSVARAQSRTGLVVIKVPPGLDVPPGSAVRDGGGEGGVRGIVLAQQLHLVFAAACGEAREGGASLAVGQKVHLDRHSSELSELARVLRVDGGTADVRAMRGAVLFEPPVTQSALARVDRPLLTGITVVDALTPIGYGQSMVIIGPEGAGKSALARRMLDRAAHAGVVAILALVPPMRAAEEGACTDASGSVGDVAGIDPDAVCTVRAAGEPTPSSGALAIAGALALGSAVRRAGGDALVAIDKASALATLWAEISATVRELLPTVSEGTVADDAQLRAFLSAFVQQSAPLQAGGSLSLLALVDVPAARADGGGGAELEIDVAAIDEKDIKASDRSRLLALQQRGIAVTASVLAKLGIRVRGLDTPPVSSAEATPAPGGAHAARAAADRVLASTAEHTISLSDGHITLDPALAARGVLPPLALNASLSRIGAGTEGIASLAPALRPLAAGLRFELVNSADSLSDEAAAVRARVATDELQARRGAAVRAILCQPNDAAPRTLADQVVLLSAAEGGLLDHASEAVLARTDLARVLVQAARAGAPSIVQRLDAVAPAEAPPLSGGERTELLAVLRATIKDVTARNPMR